MFSTPAPLYKHPIHHIVDLTNNVIQLTKNSRYDVSPQRSSGTRPPFCSPDWLHLGRVKRRASFYSECSYYISLFSSATIYTVYDNR